MKSDANVLETLAELVAIPSVNPNYSDGSGEEEIADWIFQYLTKNGVHVEKQEVLPRRFNVIAKIPSRNSHQRIILEAHMDTVSAQGMKILPYEPTIQDNKLYGRGSCDTKAGLAAMMHAIVELSQSRCRVVPEVWLAATVDEEYSYRGVAKFCENHPTADAAIVAEPTELRSVIASKGLLRFQVITEGVSAHSAKPHLGDNAILQMTPIIEAIRLDTLELENTEHPLLGSATCNIGTINGGTQINFVPDRCEIQIDRRLLPHENPEQVWQQYQQLIKHVMQSKSKIKACVLPPLLTDEPLNTEPNDHAVSTMRQILERHDLPSVSGGVPFCSDASKFGKIGIPAIILGPGSIDQAHSAIEYVECRQVEKAVELYRDFAILYASKSFRESLHP